MGLAQSPRSRSLRIPSPAWNSINPNRSSGNATTVVVPPTATRPKLTDRNQRPRPGQPGQKVCQKKESEQMTVHPGSRSFYAAKCWFH